MFDLEKAIATWRSAAERRRVYSDDDLEELEAHIRDVTDRFQRDGLTEEEAFRAAIRRLGDAFDIEEEYRKVYWTKLRHRRTLKKELMWRLAMLRNYGIIALRNLIRQPAYTGINILGLSIGMACCLLILSFVRHEWSFDQFHEDAASIFRVNIRAVTPEGDVEIKAGQPFPLAARLAESFDEIETAVLVNSRRGALIEAGDEVFEQTVHFSTSSFFDVFSFPLSAGNPETALDTPESVVVSENAARRFFRDADAMGRALRISLGGAYEDYVVTGVARDAPTSSSIEFDVILPVVKRPGYEDLADSWSSWAVNTFIRIGDPDQRRSVEARLPAFTSEYFAAMIQTWKILQWISPDEGSFELQLQPVTDLHFSPEVTGSETSSTDPRYPYFLLGLALTVLIIACINFTTLAIGRATRRSREVAMRKAVGATRSQLMQQFWGEALFMSGVSVLLGFGLVHVLLPLFAEIAGTEFALRYDAVEAAVLIGLAAITGLIAGVYPAAYQSRFRPIYIMRGLHGAAGKNRWMRVLVVIQFTLSIAFVTALIVFSAQVRYLQERNLGFDDEFVLVVPTNTSGADASEQVVDRLKGEWSSIPGVAGIAAGSTGFGRSLAFHSFGTADGEAHTLFITRIDREFLNTLNLDVLQGRAFDTEFPAAEEDVILVNEALVEAFEWDEPLGQTVGEFGEIAGVVKNYHFESLYNEVKPMVLTLSGEGDRPLRYVYVRLEPDQVGSTLAQLQVGWEKIRPDRPFSWYFLDEHLDRQYTAEIRAQQLISAATVFAILIACLG
ncbi:MAG: ABC transporter permease, partial [Bacteroidetes bacterium]|nr:ABC transporter permease [Bacteroidota bacterium]